MKYQHITSDGHTHIVTEGFDPADRRIRMLATNENIPVIRSLTSAGFDVQIGPPWAAVNFGDVTEPSAHDNMRNAMGRLDERHGGWRSATQIDHATLRLRELAENLYERRNTVKFVDDEQAETFAHECCAVGEEICEIAMGHPVWRFLSPYAIQPIPAGIVLGLIGDPRWYISPEHPYRGGKLKSHFGLERRHKGDHTLRSVKSMVDYRYFSLYSTRFLAGMWPVDPFTPLEHGLLQDINIEDTEADLKRKAEKLVRVELSRVLNYIRLIWMEVLHPDEYAFDPDKFFQQPANSAYFKQHTGCSG